MNARLTLAILAAAVALPAAADTALDERKPARADGVVDISNVAGSVEIIGWDRNEVHLSGSY